MKAVFVDTFFFLAALNPSDHAHARVISSSAQKDRPLVTTTWVLTEVANAFAKRNQRPVAVGLIQEITKDPRVKVVPATEELFERGFRLYARRLDKDWSLTDCISFVVMSDEGITDALTGDRHFGQAGFNLLL